MPAFVVDGTPQKRIFRSIIADYDLETSIMELIDNAIDHWTAQRRKQSLEINVILNVDRQIITVRDNAGGVPSDKIDLLIVPGASRENDGFEFIGNFGVGGKRAGIALGQTVVVTSRYGTGETYKFELSDDWLENDNWNVEVEPASEIEEGTTQVSISSVRQGFSTEDKDRIEKLLGAAYSKFVPFGCTISVNGSQVLSTVFDNWAYPPNFPPQTAEFSIYPDDLHQVAVKLTGGLVFDRDPVEENYGVYIYCNNRLIVSHSKSYEVGFFKGQAGVPHPDASLARVIVELSGQPELMPWTSNKSDINWSHPTILMIRDRIVALTAHFSKLSRRMKNVRETEVFPYQTGQISEIDLRRDESAKRVVDLPLPRGRRKSYAERIMDENRAIVEEKPWTLGLVEAMGIIETVSKKSLQTRNRLALVLLDSNLEIGLKEYIVHQADQFPPQRFGDAQLVDLFKKRHEVINVVKPHLSISDPDWDKVRHYYDRRNKLIHERATVQITDTELLDFRNLVERILKELFDLRLS